MPEVVTGYTTESKVVTVLNDDTDINAEINLQGVDSWLPVSLTLSGTDIIILFTRTISDAA